VSSASAQQRPVGESNPFTSAADVQQGEKIFNGRCAGCHGFKGSGGRGTDLAQAILPRASDDASLFRIIRRGIPGTEMPGAGQSTDREIWQIAAYVRSLGQQPAEPVSGDPARGAVLFKGKGGCITCHTVAGQGGRMGPRLDSVGLRRGPAHFRKTLLDPESRVPPNFAFVELIRKGSPPIRGIRVNEDTTSIQVRDLSDKLHSFWKHELTEVRRLTGKTPMPSFKDALSQADIEDVVAYLTTLRENF
jgi:putative heme-binding domain-containing protein